MCLKVVYRSRASAGLTLIEIMIALAIMVLGLIGLLSVILFTTRHNAMQRENLTAMRAAEQKIEEIITSPFDGIFVNYTTGSPGSTFDVTGLNRVASGTPVGTVTFPISGGMLDEGQTGEFTRMGSGTGDDLDLDGNGLSTDSFLDSSMINIVPFRIDLTWTGVMGSQTLTYHHIVLRR